MNSLTDEQLLELHGLCHGLVDSTLTPSERDKLAAWLRSSEEARQVYVRVMGLSASLCQYAGEMLADAPIVPRPATASRVFLFRPAFWRFTGPLAAAALLAVTFWIGSHSSEDEAAKLVSTDPEAEETVGHLSAAKACRWNGATLNLGDELRAGQRLELTAGLAEITFDSGAQVLLEAPASLEVSSAWNALLRRGAVKIHVPAQAVGFRVTHAAVDVVDLGTEFGMVADDTGGAEVVVLQGAVEATSHESSVANEAPTVLREKQGRRFSRAGAADLADRDIQLARFARKFAMEGPHAPPAYVHWSFDSLAGDASGADVAGLIAGRYEAAHRPEAVAAPAANPSTEVAADGRWSGALRLDGRQPWQAPFPNLSQRAVHTIAFWTRIAPEAELSAAGPILAWMLGGAETRPVEVAWNRNPAQGAFGALQTRVGRRCIVGSTSLRDGRWHHIAVVFIPHWRNENAIQTKLYVDGRLEGVTARYGIRRKNPNNRRNPEPPPAVRAEPALDIVTIGGSSQESPRRFHGDLDELFVFDGRLSPAEIARLMTTNQPPTVDLAAE